MRLVLLLSALAVCAALATPASGNELVQDPDAMLLSLKVNGKGEALLTYRRANGSICRVLAWGALNARAPSAEIPQVRFRWDYAGGWGKYRNGQYWKTFKNRCRPYDGPALPMLVAACKAPNGTYWTVQTWQRRLPLLGFDPWLPEHTHLELHLAHFSGELPRLEVYPNWTYGGRWQGVFGRYKPTGTFCTASSPRSRSRDIRARICDPPPPVSAIASPLPLEVPASCRSCRSSSPV